MAIQIIINAANANANNFVIIANPKAPFTIDCTTATLVGSPTWTFFVGNAGTVEADFTPYSAGTTNMPITAAIESARIYFEFIAVKFTRTNTSTGTYSFYIGT